MGELSVSVCINVIFLYLEVKLNQTSQHKSISQLLNVSTEKNVQNYSKNLTKKIDSKINFDVQLNSIDAKNWKEIKTVQNFSKNLSSEKSRLKKQTVDLYHWKEIQKIKNFTTNLSSEKYRLQKHFNQSKEKNQRNQNSFVNLSLDTSTLQTVVPDSRQKTISNKFFFQEIVPRIFSKMSIDCGSKFCSLEFHERRIVS